MKKFNGSVVRTFMALLSVVLMGVSSSAFAQVDTSTSSLTNLEAWLMTWIPLGATTVLISLFVAWWLHAIRADFMFRSAIALIGIGSASFISGLFLA